MSPTLSVEDRQAVEQALRRECGISLAANLVDTLDGALHRAAGELGVSPQVLLARVRSGDRRGLEALLEQARVGETYFFRHPEHFTVLQKELVSSLAEGARPKIWSAGCASGEELYSLAMALAEVGLLEGATLLGTDVSEVALEQARRATYGSWSLRSLEDERRERFFRGELPAQVDPALVKQVSLQRHNLVADPPPLTDCDAVFCRNVLIYFEPETVQRVLKTLVDALRPGGLLVLGPAEAGLGDGLSLTWLEREQTLVAQKREAKRPPTTRSRAARPKTSASRARPQTASRARPSSASTRAKSAPAKLPDDAFARALAAARAGREAEAEKLAREVGERELRPEAFLLLSMLAESRGQLREAIDAARRALYLDQKLAMGHATLASLLRRAGDGDAAAQARRNALALVQHLPDAAALPSVEPITAGALRAALGEPADPPRDWRGRGNVR